MTATDIYADDFSCTFQQEGELLYFLRGIELSAAWGTLPSSDMRFIALEKNTPETDDFKVQYDVDGKASVLDDTLKNTALMLQLDSGTYPVRSCAIKTILDRARISGNALSKVKKPVLADILNHCLHVASGDALYRICEDKVSAVHGGDSSDYAVLEMPALMERTSDYLNANFPGCRFTGGSYDHSLFTASWELSGNGELLNAYKEALTLHNVPFDDIKPALRLASRRSWRFKQWICSRPNAARIPVQRMICITASMKSSSCCNATAQTAPELRRWRRRSHGRFLFAGRTTICPASSNGK